MLLITPKNDKHLLMVVGAITNTIVHRYNICCSSSKTITKKNIMLMYTSFSLSITILLLSFSLSTAQPSTTDVNDIQYSYCSPTNGNYTNPSKFASNLDTILSALTAAKPVTGGFYNLTAGENSGVDQVNGIALCRGDLSSSKCNSCLSEAVKGIRFFCPNQKEAFVWYIECMLRYSNRSIFNIYESSPYTRFFNARNVSDPVRFNQQVGKLLKNLKEQAAAGDSQSKFADGSTTVSDFLDVYASVQCTPDLSFIDCSNCIEGEINNIQSCCVGRQGAILIKPSCTLRYETYLFYNSPPTSQPPTPPEISNKSNSTGKGSNGSKLTVGIIVPVIFCVVIVLLIFGWCALRRKRWKKVETSLASTSIREAEDEINSADSLQFDFSTIRDAANNFSDVDKLGRGGFGAVYKGILSNGQQVAVKRLAKNSGQGEIEFKNEVLLLAKLQHRNLVRLLGFCLEREERLLIYEFVPNRSLDHFLFDPEKRGLLDWQTRYNIISGIARGLLYLHEDSRLRIIHRDLKASNILLDADMVPKIADFGLARLFQVDQTQGDTNRVVGTYGYMAPEYALHGLFSAKSDVYSFGILLLEMITGRKSIGLYQGGDSEDLISRVWRNWREGTAANVVDETLSTVPRNEIMRCEGTAATVVDETLSTVPRNEIMRCVNIGLLCVQEEAKERPTMSSVVIMLNSHSFTLPVMTHPAYITRSLTPFHTLSEEHSSGVIRSLGSKTKSLKYSENDDSGCLPFVPR